MDTKAGNGMALMTAKLIDNIAAKLINLQTEAQNNSIYRYLHTCVYTLHWMACMYVCMCI